MKPLKSIFTSIAFPVLLSSCRTYHEKDLIPYVRMGKNGPEHSYNPDGYILNHGGRGQGYSKTNEIAIDTILNQTPNK